MLILASKSPRRKQILEMAQIPFEVEESHFDESKIPDGLELDDLPNFLACQKAMEVFKKHPNDTVIGSDTIVCINNMVLGKPKNKEENRQMIKLLQGHIHEVITGVCIVSSKKSVSFINKSYVEFYPMNDEEIIEYVDSNEGLDKAGGYAIQGIGGKFIKKIDGDFYSVMGLPLSSIVQALKEF